MPAGIKVTYPLEQKGSTHRDKSDVSVRVGFENRIFKLLICGSTASI